MRFRESVMIDEDHLTYLYVCIYIYIVNDWITGRRSTWCFPSWSSAPFVCPYETPLICECWGRSAIHSGHWNIGIPSHDQPKERIPKCSLPVHNIIEIKDHKSHHSTIGGKQTRICKTKASRVLNLTFPPCLFSSIVSIVVTPASCRPPPRPVNAVCRRNWWDN